MLTFTWPEALRGVLRANQKVRYRALFAASAEAIKALAKDKRHGGRVVVDSLAFCTPGGVSCNITRIFTTSFRAVLSTQNRADDTAHRNPFFLPVRGLSRLFRGKF